MGLKSKAELCTGASRPEWELLHEVFEERERGEQDKIT
jgi:hypothetical protein